MEINKICSIQDLLEAISERKTSDDNIFWYRGQSNKTWGLLPTMLRSNLRCSEETLVTRFKQNASMLIGDKPNTYFDWLFLMQHYGVPTRLLDWTESPLIALYFAVEKEDTDDGALWLLDPLGLNREARVTKPTELQFIPSFDDELLQPYSGSSESRTEIYPIATIATRNSVRIQAQQGVFTIHHPALPAKPIEDIGDQKHFHKIEIPGKDKLKIKRQLKLLGISRFQLFPELSSVSELVKEVM
jgi:hypothetical protein